MPIAPYPELEPLDFIGGPLAGAVLKFGVETN